MSATCLRQATATKRRTNMESRQNLEMLEQAARSGDERARIELANRLLAQHRLGSPEHERGLAMLRQAAEGPRAVEAQWFLGAYFLQVSVRPDVHREAARWLERAASAGFAPAIDRLADLSLQGLGVPRSPQRALALQRHLADQGSPQAAWYAGYLLSQKEGVAAEPGDDATAFARGCALGYPPAYYSLGLRFALGAGVERDGAFARALLSRAAAAGFPDARAAADELAPESEHGTDASQWYARLKHNLDAAPLERLIPGSLPVGHPMNPVVAQLEKHFAAVGHPLLRIDETGRLVVAPGGGESLRAAPAAWDWLAQRPRVGLSRAFATREECAHLMGRVGDSLAQPREYRRKSSINDDAEIENFSGRGRPLGAMHTDAVVRCLERRIAEMTQWPIDAFEPCSIIRYQSSEEYRPHVDFFSREQIELNRSEGTDFGGQRIATFLLYLRAPEAGGETVYDKAGVTVTGESGLGVLHYNVTPDGVPDEQSLHSGLPVKRGEKWLWRSTLREQSPSGPTAG